MRVHLARWRPSSSRISIQILKKEFENSEILKKGKAEKKSVA